MRRGNIDSRTASGALDRSGIALLGTHLLSFAVRGLIFFNSVSERSELRRAIGYLFLLICIGSPSAEAAITNFAHIVIIVQENRTPDNLFQGLCTNSGACSTNPNLTQYNIQTSNWLNKDAQGGVTQPWQVGLDNDYDIKHSNTSFVAMCDKDPKTGVCQMDGAAGEWCYIGKCPNNPPFAYVNNSQGILNPYLTLAKSYGWANYMFQTNRGPSFPAHQFLFGATSAPSTAADHSGTFASENDSASPIAGCTAPEGTIVQLIDANGVEDPKNTMFPCFEHDTLADLLTTHGFSWRYYTVGKNGIWTAPNAINHICVPNGGQCTGSAFKSNVDPAPSDVLKDAANCKLPYVSWVIPTGQNSDHADGNTGGGPSWVASIVNAIGNSKCKDGANTYWTDTAILITWDDWGGWYDHVPPPILAYPQGGYQWGFRVPFIFVSAYTRPGYINNLVHDFGTIARFVEHNSLLQEGALTFADARGWGDLAGFYGFGRPRTFKTIPAPLDAKHFLDDKSPPLPPDND